MMTDSLPGSDVAYHLPISKWQVQERPRERFLSGGPERLSDAELIGLILGSGTRGKTGAVSAVDLGRVLLRHFESLHRLSVRDVQELTRINGIGAAKAVRLAAAFELGRRTMSQENGPRIQVGSPEDVASVYGPLLRDLKKEVFKVVLLNTSNVIIGQYTASEGGLAASIVEPRAVFQRAILENAAAVICLHNHPSGNPEPSREDIRITRQLVEAGKLMGIPIHDHIIIAGKGYTSLAERGLMG
jgi:DNA repair protein RadC